MAALAQLSYERWERRVERGLRPVVEVNASLVDGRWSERAKFVWDEATRWATCVADAASQTPLPPGGRYPRMTNRTTVRARCDRYAHRKWELKWWLHGWFESGPAATRWHSTNALVAARPDAVAVAFRGSTDVRHAVTNIQPLTQDSEGKTLHGMRRAFERVDRGGIAWLSDERDELVDGFFEGMPTIRNNLAACLSRFLGRVVARGRRAIIVGHSLGGALALQLALRLPATPNVEVYTFGEPEFGDDLYYSARRKRREDWIRRRYHRYVAVAAAPDCETDLVTRITKPFGAGEHFARPIYVCEGESPRGPVAAHSMAGYVRALKDTPASWLHLDYVAGPRIDGIQTADERQTTSDLLTSVTSIAPPPPARRSRFGRWGPPTH